MIPKRGYTFEKTVRAIDVFPAPVGINLQPNIANIHDEDSDKLAPGLVGGRSRQCKCLFEAEVAGGQVSRGTLLPEVPTYCYKTAKT